jgi:hypothetical protein
MKLPFTVEAVCGVTIVIAYLAFLASTNAQVVLWPALVTVLLAGAFAAAAGVSMIRQAKRNIPDRPSWTTAGGRSKLFKYAYGGTAIAFSGLLAFTSVSYALLNQTGV